MHDVDDDFHGEVPWLHLHRHGHSPGEDIEGIEKFTLRSVGIDVGSSTSHLVFSQLTLRRAGAAHSTRFQVSDRQVLYRSPILLTPYLSGTRIDVDALTDFIHAAYAEAGVTADEVDTGAVVITGEALKKENAQPIAEFFARDAGKFICASAGPNHEALLAAYGSGAVALSAAEQAGVLSVDVGGGTAKLSTIRGGVVEQTAAVEVGARLLAFDAARCVTRIEAPARVFLHELGETVELGDVVSEATLARFADLLAAVLFHVIRGRAPSPLVERLLLTPPLALAPDLVDVRHVVFSGGVSEYIYEREPQPFGDVGRLLAAAIRREVAALGRPDLVHLPAEGIRATVIGAGEYTVQVSGNTSYLSTRDVLPLFGLQVVRPVLDAADSVEQALRRALAKFDRADLGPGLALALPVSQQPDYALVRRLAEGIAAVAGRGEGAPLVLVLDADLAKSLGGILEEELGLARPVVAVDGIDVGDLEYLDVGRPMGVSEALPVTVKSLLFPTPAARQPV
jgi:ethanolamine utilization protein EutA